MTERSGVLALALASAMATAAVAPPAAAAGDTLSVPTGERGGDSRPDRVSPFEVRVPDEALEDLRRRILASRLPDKETVDDNSQGLPRNALEEILAYWANDYDWRRAEARLNAYPQFTTKIEGLDIHFIHVRSRHTDALPIIITHGWPGSVFELLDVIEPLTNPEAHGGHAGDAFDVVIPSMPGYGFSGKPTVAGWDAERIGEAWHILMLRLGYHGYVAQGGDWGAAVASAMARRAPQGPLAIHVNLPAAQPPEVAAAIAANAPAPRGLNAEETAAFEQLRKFFRGSRAYAAIMATKPQVIGTALADSPSALAAFMLDYHDQEPLRRLERDQVLDSITLHWLANTGASGARLYWEEGGRSVTNAEAQKTREIAVPVAITVFPGEVYRAPESWVRRAYPNVSYFRHAETGGHFAAWEQPALFVRELRAAFGPMRQRVQRRTEAAHQAP